MCRHDREQFRLFTNMMRLVAAGTLDREESSCPGNDSCGCPAPNHKFHPAAVSPSLLSSLSKPTFIAITVLLTAVRSRVDGGCCSWRFKHFYSFGAGGTKAYPSQDCELLLLLLLVTHAPSYHTTGKSILRNVDRQNGRSFLLRPLRRFYKAL